jgi:hypothetical protein
MIVVSMMVPVPILIHLSERYSLTAASPRRGVGGAGKDRTSDAPWRLRGGAVSSQTTRLSERSGVAQLAKAVIST